jgi:hypothetical protein
MPVKTMASPASSAAAMTSSSRMEPPGWITAVAPAFGRCQKPVGEGEEGVGGATASPWSGFPAGPAPRPCVLGLAGRDAGAVDAAHLAGADADRGAPSLHVDDGVGLHVLRHAPGEEQVASSCSVGWRLVTTARSASSTPVSSLSCTSRPPATCHLGSGDRRAGGRPPVVSRRRFFFARRSPWPRAWRRGR